MIRRILFYFLKLSLFVVLAVWVANRPGFITLDWMGYRLETSVAFALFCLFILLVVVVVLARVWLSVRTLPRLWGQSRRTHRRDAGDLALKHGMIAVAQGDGVIANQSAAKAGRLLGDQAPLVLLLRAQAAHLCEDDASATRVYETMMSVPDLAVLGLRGLMAQAQKRGDRDTALTLAQQAQKRAPKSAWAAETLFTLYEQCGDLESAEETLSVAVRHGAMTRAQGDRKRALVGYLRAVRLNQDNKLTEALNAAKTAHKLAPSLSALTILYADLLNQKGKRREARHLLKKAWAHDPHRDLATAFLQACDSADPVHQVRELAQLIQGTTDHRESRIALACANMDAGLWGAARTQLETLCAEDRPSRTLCQLMARLEQGEHSDAAQATLWLQRAMSAPVPMTWLCHACGGGAEKWTPHCPHCEGLDSLNWSRPRWSLETDGQLETNPESPTPPAVAALPAVQKTEPPSDVEKRLRQSGA